MKRILHVGVFAALLMQATSIYAIATNAVAVWPIRIEYSDTLGGPPEEDRGSQGELALVWRQLPPAFEFRVDGTNFEENFSTFNTTVSLWATAPPHSQLRLSPWTMLIDLTVTDLVSGTQLFSESKSANYFENSTPGIFTVFDVPRYTTSGVRVTGNISFESGAHLIPSRDPACESIDCMDVARDQMSAYVSVRVATVPEPSILSMMLLGGLAIAGAARQRKTN